MKKTAAQRIRDYFKHPKWNFIRNKTYKEYVKYKSK